MLTKIKNLLSYIRGYVDAICRLKIRHASNIPKLTYMGYTPSPTEFASGGRIKLISLAKVYPESLPASNILYHISSVGNPYYTYAWLQHAHKRGIKIITNQNGVAYPGCYGKKKTKAINYIMRKKLLLSDYVIYQSNFCKMAANIFLGVYPAKHTILYNPVNTNHFSPTLKKIFPEHIVIMLGGNQYERYRLDLALNVFSIVRKTLANALLIVTGDLNWTKNKQEAKTYTQNLMRNLGISNAVTFLGPYTQVEAPNIINQANILLHTKYNDPCPGIVLEALACGLPVVYAKSGGVPELVPNTCGIGIEVPFSWDDIKLPNPSLMAQAIIKIAKNYTAYNCSARQRAVDIFDSDIWLTKHQEIFEKILAT